MNPFVRKSKIYFNFFNKHQIFIQLLSVFSLMFLQNALAFNQPIKIFASQRFTAQIAKEIGGQDVLVTETKNERKDPHHFEITLNERKALAEADIVILNGLGYESWATRLNFNVKKTKHNKPIIDKQFAEIQSHFKKNKIKKNQQKIIVIADLLDKDFGHDPHLWYHPKALPTLAEHLFHEISIFFPANKQKYEKKLLKILARYKQLDILCDEIREKYAGIDISATESIFSHMATNLQLNMLHTDLQHAIMNHSEPSIKQLSAFENDLKNGKIKILIDNIETHSPFTKHFVKIAKKNKIPVVTVSETLPVHAQTHADWMTTQLQSLKQALEEYDKSHS